MSLLDSKHALTVLTRLAARRPEQRARLREALTARVELLAPLAFQVAIETGDPIGSVLAEVVQDRTYEGLLRDLDERLPMQTTALRELALLIIRRRYEADVYGKELRTDAEVLNAARLLALYAVRLADLGRLQQSVETNAAALKLLTDADIPEEISAPIRAELLHNAANGLGDLGDSDQALSAAMMAIDAHAILVGRGQEPVSQLADSMNQAATIFIEKREDAEAEALLIEAIALIERDGDTAPQTRFVRARLGNNLALCRMADTDAALAQLRTAIDLARGLSEAWPDAYQPYLARYLVNRARAHLSAGDEASAREDIAEGLAIWQTLAVGRPDAFSHDYLVALEVVADLDGASNQKSTTSAMIDQLEKAEHEPGRWRRWWSRLGQRMASEAGEDWNAITKSTDRVLAELARSTPASDEDVEAAARTLLMNGVAHRRSGEVEQAIEAGERAVAMLEGRSGGAIAARRAQAHQMLAGFYADADRIDQATASFRTALNHHRATGDEAELATCAQIAVECLLAKAPKETVDLIQEALAGLSDAAPTATVAGLLARRAAAYAALAASTGSDGDEAADEARQCAARLKGNISVEDRRDSFGWLSQAGKTLASVDQARDSVRTIFEATLACLGRAPHLGAADLSVEFFTALFNQARTLSSWGDNEGAIALFKRAVALHEERRASHPREPPLGLAASFDALARALKKAGRPDEALSNARAAVSVYEEAYALDGGASGADYAIGLNNLSNRLWESGLREESFATVERCLLLIDALPAGVVDRTAPVFGTALGSLIERGGELGRPVEELLNRFISRFSNKD